MHKVFKPSKVLLRPVRLNPSSKELEQRIFERKRNVSEVIASSLSPKDCLICQLVNPAWRNRMRCINLGQRTIILDHTLRNLRHV